MSSTLGIPVTDNIPRHIAIIMDGNGRWATRRFLPRIAGHHRGVESVRKTVDLCTKRGVKFLTLFAFSSENWRRPKDEVSLLMGLFVTVLEREVNKLHRNNIRLKVVGDLSAFDPKLQKLIQDVELKTANNTQLTLTICANYGGRWDVLQATRQLLLDNSDLAANPNQIQESDLAKYLSLGYAPEPDLFVRTGGEKRISNFLVWQLAYTELYFTECFWPDFNESEFDKAILSYQQRERRFGQTSEQLIQSNTKQATHR